MPSYRKVRVENFGRADGSGGAGPGQSQGDRATAPAETSGQSAEHRKDAAPSEQSSTAATPAAVLLKIAEGEYSYAKLGLVLGMAALVGGALLGTAGALGNSSLTAKFLGMETTFSDATPGGVLALIGFFMVYATRPKLNMKNIRI